MNRSVKTVFVLCFIAISCAAQPCFAQERSVWAIGAIGGLYGSAPSGDHAALSESWFAKPAMIDNWTVNFKGGMESQSTMLLRGGLYVQYYFTRNLAAQVGFMYKPEAWLYEREVTFNDPAYYPWLRQLRFEGRFSYIDFPLLLKAVFDVKGDLLPYVYAGPDVAVLVSHSLVGRSGSNTLSTDHKAFHAKADVRNTVLGACIGAGAYVRTKKKVMLGLDFRYSWGLQSAVNTVTIDDSQSRELDLRFSSWGINGVMEVPL